MNLSLLSLHEGNGFSKSLVRYKRPVFMEPAAFRRSASPPSRSEAKAGLISRSLDSGWLSATTCGRGACPTTIDRPATLRASSEVLVNSFSIGNFSKLRHHSVECWAVAAAVAVLESK